MRSFALCGLLALMSGCGQEDGCSQCGAYDECVDGTCMASDEAGEHCSCNDVDERQRLQPELEVCLGAK